MALLLESYGYVAGKLNELVEPSVVYILFGEQPCKLQLLTRPLVSVGGFISTYARR